MKHTIGRDLRSTVIKKDYRSGEDNLLKGFYIPCLQQSKLYLRAVGYFDSSALSAAARGLAAFIRGDGEMRLIASPVLSEQDAEAIIKARSTGAAIEGIIIEALGRELREQHLESLLVRRRIECLAWLVSEGRLKIKIAYPPPETGRNPRGIYHEKLGVFQDDLGQLVAFSGSINESQQGWTGNFEAFDVYASWRSADKERAERKISIFQGMWEDNTPGLRVIDLPAAIGNDLIRYRPARMPEYDPEGELEFDQKGLPTTAVRKGLWKNQEKAITAWASNDFKGIMAMATGSGKTLAALEAAALAPKNVATVILVPTVALVNQWEREVREFEPRSEVIVCSAGKEEWSLRLMRRLGLMRHGSVEGSAPDDIRLYVVTTMASASSDKFLLSFKGINECLIQVIGDEVHHLGAPKFRRCMTMPAARRLGLSATPERQWDDIGTQAIVQYFGPTIYEYTIKCAITDGRLCHYEYRPYFAYLEEQEFDEYIRLTHEIERLFPLVSEDDKRSVYSPKAEHLQRLLEKRALIKKKAKDKLRVFREILGSNPPRPLLVFCEDNEQLAAMKRALKETGNRFVTFTSEESDWQRQQALELFRKRETDVLLAIRCLDEGVDLPECPAAVIVASSSSTREFVQRRGRILRIGSKANIAMLHDIVVLPTGMRVPRDMSIAEGLIRQELSRVKQLAEAADNKWAVRLYTEKQLEKSGLEQLAFI